LTTLANAPVLRDPLQQARRRGDSDLSHSDVDFVPIPLGQPIGRAQLGNRSIGLRKMGHLENPQGED
jgi:hypothetical protein